MEVVPKKKKNDISSFLRQIIQHHSNQVDTPNSNAEEADHFYEDLQSLVPKTDVLFMIGGWKAKAGGQEIARRTGKIGLGVQNEVGQRLTQFCQESMLVTVSTFLQQTQEATLYMDIIRWSILRSD